MMRVQESILRRPGPPVRDQVVLLVDDEPEILRSIVWSLRAVPFEVMTAASADEALGRFSERVPDLVVADQWMPGMKGTELLSKIRQCFPGTARALLTGYPGAAVVQEGQEAGVDAFVIKPWDDGVLRVTVRRLLGSRGQVRPPFKNQSSEINEDMGKEG